VRYFEYLRGRLVTYTIWGIVAGTVLSACLVIYRYDTNLTELISQLMDVGTKTTKIRQEIREIDYINRYMYSEFGIKVVDYDGDSLLLKTLDTLRRDFQGAAFSISSLQHRGNLSEISLQISKKIRANSEILDHVLYLESLRLPDFRFEEIRLTDGSEGVNMDIKGKLVLPSSQDQGGAYG